jgi:hypothetical protein
MSDRQLPWNGVLHAVTILSGPSKPEYRAPAVQHEHYAIAEIERIPERKQIVAVFGITQRQFMRVV